MANSCGGNRIWRNFLRDRLQVVSNYERSKVTRKASEANNFRQGFLPLLFFTEIKNYPRSRHDSSKSTGSIREVSTPLAKEVKRNFVPREKDSSDPNGRCHHPEEERNTLFVRSASSLKRTTLFQEGQQPRYQERKINRAKYARPVPLLPR